MDATELLVRLKSRGIVLTASGDNLVADHNGEMIAAARDLIRAHKPDLLGLLSGSCPAAPPVESHAAGDVRHGLDLSTFLPPRRTSWGTIVYSAPDAPTLECFGPSDREGVAAPTVPTSIATPRGPRDVRHGDRWLPFHSPEPSPRQGSKDDPHP
jgi:hypothetical protein